MPGGLPSIAQLQPLVVLTLGLHPQGLLLAAVLGVKFPFIKLLVASEPIGDLGTWIEMTFLFFSFLALLSNP